MEADEVRPALPTPQKKQGILRTKREMKRLESVMEDRWLSVDEIAAYLGIKRDTVYNWITHKKMPAHKMGRFWKFRRKEVDEWVTSGGAAETTSNGKGA